MGYERVDCTYFKSRICSILRVREKVQKVDLLRLIPSNAAPMPAGKKVCMRIARRGHGSRLGRSLIQVFETTIWCSYGSNDLVIHPLVGVFEGIPVHHLVNIALFICMGVLYFGVLVLKLTLLKLWHQYLFELKRLNSFKCMICVLYESVVPKTLMVSTWSPRVSNLDISRL